MALYITVQSMYIRVRHYLVDNGYAINICPFRTAQQLGLNKWDLLPYMQFVRACDNTQNDIEGVSML